MSWRFLLRIVSLSFLIVEVLLFFWWLFQPQVVVVPHHDYVASLRKVFLHEVQLRRPLTRQVIIISTNHFSKYQTNITTTSEVIHNNIHFEALLHKTIHINDEEVMDDHGIVNVLRDVKSIWPRAKVIPFLIGSQVNQDQLNTLVQPILHSCRDDCLIIASVDFSHYLPASIAEAHDIYSIKSLSQMNTETIQHAETDSPQTLGLVMKIASIKRAIHWILHNHTNPGMMEKNYFAETTTHVFGWYQFGLPTINPVLSHSFFVIHTSYKEHLSDLGARLMYGNDDTIILDHPFTFSTITFQPLPLNGVTSVSCLNNKITISLSPNMTVSGWTSLNQTYIGFNGLTASSSGNLLWSKTYSHISFDPLCLKKVIVLPGTLL